MTEPAPPNNPTTGGRSLVNRTLGEKPSLGPLAPDAEEEILREEFEADLARVRAVVPVALVLYVLTISSDLLAATYVDPRPFAPILIVRLITIGIVSFVLWAIKSKKPSRKMFEIYCIAMFWTVAISLAMIAAYLGGITHAHGAAIACVMICSGFSLPRPWRRGIGPKLLEASSFSLVMIAGSLFVPRIREQWGDPRAVGLFMQVNLLLLTTMMLLLHGGHVYWALRRTAIASRRDSRCRLLEVIGVGGMGEVWRAYHPGLSQEVAVKVLRASPSDKDSIRRFELEIRSTAELTHPNTVRVLDCGVTGDDLWYYSMELLRGESLADLVDREKCLEPARAVYILHQTCRAISEAHERGLIHRDIKPENIFITNQGGESDFVKVLDFGIAKVLEEASPMTREGVIMGTLRYMSLEQERGDKTDKRTDVYALGAVLYFALTGAPPIPGNSLPEMILNRQRIPILAPSRRDESIPQVLDEIVLRCLAHEPELRYPDARALASALEATHLHRLSYERPSARPHPFKFETQESQKTVRAAPDAKTNVSMKAPS